MKKIFIPLIIYCICASFAPIEVFYKDDLLGKNTPEKHKDFIKVPNEYCNHNGHYLRIEVLDAFIKMARDAKKEGVHLEIISSTRNFYRQKTIWNNKYNRLSGSPVERAKEILRYSSMPGTSRHHWGTDFDLNSVEPAYFNTPNGQKIYNWLKNNASKYGFGQPYTAKNKIRVFGYEEEKWHWSYVPTANKIIRAYNVMVSYDDFEGFLGSSAAIELDVINTYVNSILPE